MEVGIIPGRFTFPWVLGLGNRRREEIVEVDDATQAQAVFHSRRRPTDQFLVGGRVSKSDAWINKEGS